MSASELKRLQTQVSTINAEIIPIQKQINDLQERVNKLYAERAKVKAEIDRMQAGPPIVTEHAILRYLERKYGFDIETIKREILPDKVIDQYKVLGGGKYPVDGFKVVIKNNAVVTILPS